MVVTTHHNQNQPCGGFRQKQEFFPEIASTTTRELPVISRSMQLVEKTYGRTGTKRKGTTSENNSAKGLR